MKKLFFTALLLFFVAGVYGQKKVLKSAEKALKKGEYAEALTLAKQASENAETKDDPEVYVTLGLLLKKVMKISKQICTFHQY